MAASNKNGSGPISDINVTPLVDIMLVLVIILMVTAEFTRYKTIPVSLPKVNAAAVKTEPHRVTVTIKKTGDLFVQDKAALSLEIRSARFSMSRPLGNEHGETTREQPLRQLGIERRRRGCAR